MDQLRVRVLIGCIVFMAFGYVGAVVLHWDWVDLLMVSLVMVALDLGWPRLKRWLDREA